MYSLLSTVLSDVSSLVVMGSSAGGVGAALHSISLSILQQCLAKERETISVTKRMFKSKECR